MQRALKYYIIHRKNRASRVSITLGTFILYYLIRLETCSIESHMISAAAAMSTA